MSYVFNFKNDQDAKVFEIAFIDEIGTDLIRAGREVTVYSVNDLAECEIADCIANMNSLVHDQGGTEVLKKPVHNAACMAHATICATQNWLDAGNVPVMTDTAVKEITRWATGYLKSATVSCRCDLA